VQYLTALFGGYEIASLHPIHLHGGCRAFLAAISRLRFCAENVTLREIIAEKNHGKLCKLSFQARQEAPVLRTPPS